MTRDHVAKRDEIQVKCIGFLGKRVFVSVRVEERLVVLCEVESVQVEDARTGCK